MNYVFILELFLQVDKYCFSNLRLILSYLKNKVFLNWYNFLQPSLETPPCERRRRERHIFLENWRPHSKSWIDPCLFLSHLMNWLLNQLKNFSYKRYWVNIVDIMIIISFFKLLPGFSMICKSENLHGVAKFFFWKSWTVRPTKINDIFSNFFCIDKNLLKK